MNRLHTRRSQPKRLWLFRITAVLLTLPFLGMIELGLRMAGFGYPVSLFLKRPVGGVSVLTENDRFGFQFFPPAVARAPLPFSMPQPKPPGTYRIFVLGESAALGDPEPAFGFPRMLAVLLQTRYPGTHFEVVNVAMTAINSHAILSVAQDCAKHEGDLWVIYMGNNEVHGPFGAGVALGWEAPPRAFIRAFLALNSLRLGQAMVDLTRRLSPDNPAATSWQGLQMFMDHQVASHDPRLGRVYSSFESNLEAILTTGSRAGVAQILCSVGTNLKDMPPLASQHGAGFAPASDEAWEKSYTNAITAEAGGRFSAAADAYLQAAELDPDYAELQFRLGRCSVAQGRYLEAQRYFERARDLDALRFRTDSRLNGIIERLGKAKADQAVYFLDIARLLASTSLHGLVGYEWFCDHVHFAPRGNFLVARALADQIAPILPISISRGAMTNQWLSDADCLRRLGWNDWCLSQALQDLSQRMRHPPFNTQLGHAERDAGLAGQLAALAPALQPLGLTQSVMALRQALDWAPDDPFLHDRLAGVLAQSGDVAGAIQHWQTVTQLLPYYPVSYHSLGRLLWRNGRSLEAEQNFAAELRLDPYSAQGFHGMGVALAQQCRWPEAIRFYQRALRLRPASTLVRTDLAFALEKHGNLSQALFQRRELVRLQPGTPLPRVNLGNLLLRLNQPTEGLAQLRKAVELAPDFPDAHLALGRAFETESNLVEAISQYRLVLQLDQTNDSARAYLAQALARQPQVR